MGFVGGILRKYGRTSSIGGNFGTSLNLGTKKHPPFSTLVRGNTYLEDIKQNGTLEQKKTCLKDILEEMIWRMRKGIRGGCVDPKKIRIIDNRACLPDEAYVEAYVALKSPGYIFSVKDLAVYLHEHDQMTSRDNMKFQDFKIYSGLLTNIRDLVLLSGHPHLQTTLQEMEYIPAALHQMELIPNRFSDKHFPLPTRSDSHRVSLSIVLPRHLLYNWRNAYKKVCIKRTINIAASIAGASKEFQDVYDFRHPKYKPTPYIDDDAIHELRYYSNVIKHACQYGDNTLLDSLHDMFPFNTKEMYKFHWMYDGHAKGTIDLESILQQDRLF